MCSFLLGLSGLDGRARGILVGDGGFEAGEDDRLGGRGLMVGWMGRLSYEPVKG